jgi:hypothetical protein
MKPSPGSVLLALAILIWVVAGWPFNRRYHPIAEGFFEFAFFLAVIVLPIFLEWLDRRSNKSLASRK